MTPDPLGFTDGPNLYAYVHNNPMTLFDLYGLFIEDEDIGRSDLFFFGAAHGAGQTAYDIAHFAITAARHPVDTSFSIMKTFYNAGESAASFVASQDTQKYEKLYGSIQDAASRKWAAFSQLSFDDKMYAAGMGVGAVGLATYGGAVFSKGFTVFTRAEAVAGTIEGVATAGQRAARPFETAFVKEARAGSNVKKSCFAESSKQGANLQRHLGYVEEYGQTEVKHLANQRIRYYGEFESAKTPGVMAGRRYVHEFDPLTGRSRGWNETLDHDHKIRQVRPQNADGQKQHYTFDSDGNYTGSW